MTFPSTNRLLLIEDNPGDARLLKTLLKAVQNPSIHIVWASKLFEGIQHLSSEEFDIVLTNLNLLDSVGLW